MRRFKGIVICLLVVVLLLAAGVCMLHGINAVSLRGEAAFRDYAQKELFEPAGIKDFIFGGIWLFKKSDDDRLISL